MHIRKLFIKNMSWMILLRILTQTIVIAKLIILTRILTPNDFGLFAVITTSLTIVESVSELGLNYAVIHLQSEVKIIARTLLIINSLRGILLGALILISSPLIALFFNRPDIMTFLMVCSCIPILKGFINPHTITFQKDLLFKKEFIQKITPIVTSTIITILVTFYTPNITSLVVGLIFGALSEVIMSYIIGSRNFSASFNKTYFIKLFAYGKWITTGGIFSYLATQIDTISVGKILGTTSLGLYDIAFRTGSLAFNEVTNVISQVMFPIYSRVKKDKVALKRIFTKNILLTTFFAFIINLPLFLFPELIIKLLFGDQWIEASPVLRALSIYGFLKAAVGPIGPLMLAVGLPQTLAKLNIIHFVILSIIIIPMIYRFGITGAAISMTVSYVLITPYYFYKVLFLFRK